MSPEPTPLDEFRRYINRRARQFPGQWDASRQLVEKAVFPSTVARLRQCSQEQNLPAGIKEALSDLFGQKLVERIQDLNGDQLKALTGLPPAKALRALCIFFDLIAGPSSQWPISELSSERIQQLVQATANPFDLLLHTDVASVLDLGAGDLSFASELVESYLPKIQEQNRRLILHCLDRLDPHSTLGGPLHPAQDKLRRLREKLGFAFSFFGDQDMFDLRSLNEQGKLAPRYSIVTCWAPATPTFAYEPSRLSQSVITKDLIRTKGTFQSTRYRGEAALEVQHGDRALLFPPWKFEIVGPRSLLGLMAQRGSLCVLGSVDAQVFWELLAQLLDEPRYRPADRLFTPANIPEIFGEIYRVLDRLAMGDSVNLAELGTVRRRSLLVDSSTPDGCSTDPFRYVRISRGATFPGMPASSTARSFSAMTEEAPPWFLTIIPN